MFCLLNLKEKVYFYGTLHEMQPIFDSAKKSPLEIIPIQLMLLSLNLTDNVEPLFLGALQGGCLSRCKNIPSILHKRKLPEFLLITAYRGPYFAI